MSRESFPLTRFGMRFPYRRRDEPFLAVVVARRVVFSLQA